MSECNCERQPVKLKPTWGSMKSGSGRDGERPVYVAAAESVNGVVWVFCLGDSKFSEFGQWVPATALHHATVKAIGLD